MIRIGKTITKHKSSSLLFLLITISIVLLSYSSGKYNFSPKIIGNSVFSVFQIAANSTSNFVTNTLNSIGELRKLRAEHDYLLEKIMEYQIRDRDYIEVKLENDRLKLQLDFKLSSEFIFKTAEIIAHEPGNIFNSIVINRGTSQGVENNMPVIAYQYGYQGLVGKIIEAGPYTSKILPIFDNTCYVAARLMESRYEGLINGSGNRNGSLLMNYVTKNAFKSLKEGDLVVTSGMQSIYPPGLYIGRIREIDNPEWQTSLVLGIEPVIDFSRIEYVLILTGEK